MEWLNPNRNSLEEIAIFVVIAVYFTIASLRSIMDVDSNMALYVARYYHLPIFGAGGILALAGWGWWAASAFGLWLLFLAMFVSYRSGLFFHISRFPIFSRCAIYAGGTYPVVGLIAYGMFSPWGEGHYWPLVFALVSYGAIISMSSLELYKKFDGEKGSE